MKQSIYINSQDIVDYLKFSRKINTTIEQISHYKIIELVAAEAEVEISLEEFQQASNNFRIKNQLYSTDGTFSWMHHHYLSLNDFKFVVYINALAHKLAQDLFADRVDSWFEQHQLEYASVRLYEIILQNRDLAEKLFIKLQKPQVCFYETARQYLQDKSDHNIRGHLGIVERKDLSPEIATLVFAASPPEILQPIKSNRGNHLILVEEIIQPELNEQLRNQIISELFSNWLQQKSQEIEICVQIDRQNSKSSD